MTVSDGLERVHQLLELELELELVLMIALWKTLQLPRGVGQFGRVRNGRVSSGSGRPYDTASRATACHLLPWPALQRTQRSPRVPAPRRSRESEPPPDVSFGPPQASSLGGQHPTQLAGQPRRGTPARRTPERFRHRPAASSQPSTLSTRPTEIPSQTRVRRRTVRGSPRLRSSRFVSPSWRTTYC